MGGEDGAVSAAAINRSANGSDMFDEVDRTSSGSTIVFWWGDVIASVRKYRNNLSWFDIYCRYGATTATKPNCNYWRG
jgi:hypothetical protein